ncbi:glycosyltransferase family 4 protein [Candidatus Nomurabacteria bacterium]|nr:glycosyltransferase family 4 protein [Candidatus Nomurabacteria bacterium]
MFWKELKVSKLRIMMDTGRHFSTLFITRKYPPMTGGMEHMMHGLINYYPGRKYAVTYGGSQKWLPIIYIWLFIKASFILLTRKIEVVHISDGVMAPMGRLIQLLFRKKVSVTVHGKDLDFGMSLYQKFVIPFIKKMDFYMPNSHETLDKALRLGIPKSKCTVITPGIDTKAFDFSLYGKEKQVELATKYNIDFSKKIIFTSGRLSERKGVKWFIANVLPELGDEYQYFVAGADGTEINDLKSMFGIKKVTYAEEINKIIKEKGLSAKVTLLGRIPFDDLKAMYKFCDVFVTPNIRVKGDQEGFGIVNIEASYAGTPVVSSNIEGIKDAIIDGVTGSLVEEKNVEQYINAITNWVKKRSKDKKLSEKISNAVYEKYDWVIIGEKYFKIISDLAGTSDSSLKEVLWISRDYPPFGGGQGVYVAQLHKLYLKQNLKSRVLVSEIGSLSDQRRRKDTIYKNVYPVGVHTGSTLFVPFAYLYYRKHKKVFKNVNVIHCNGIDGLFFLIFKNSHIKYCVTIHNTYIQRIENKRLNLFLKLLYPLFTYIEKYVIRKADEVISVSNFTAKYIEAYGMDVKVNVVENGVDTKVFVPVKKSKEQFNFLFIGRLVRSKKPFETIRIYEKFVRNFGKGINTNLYMLGTGPLYDDLLEYARKKKLFTVHIEGYQDTKKYLEKSNCFLLFSFREGLPLTLLESVSAGLAIVITKTAMGDSDIVKENINGYIVNPEIDEDEIVDKMYKTVKNFNRLSLESRKIALKHDWSKVAEETISLYL